MLLPSGCLEKGVHTGDASLRKHIYAAVLLSWWLQNDV